MSKEYRGSLLSQEILEKQKQKEKQKELEKQARDRFLAGLELLLFLFSPVIIYLILRFGFTMFRV